jgi:NAD(P)-dependent dehydrogenase (short-subunit alcohol dehydrogenase family)
MSRTVLITGASTGIGRATAQRFQADGWNVVATMRSTSDGEDLAALPRVLVTRLDVTDLPSIAAAVAEATATYGGIDVLVNNAGFGAYGALEVTSAETIRRQFDTNVIGLLDVTKAVLPVMREQGHGVIVNISSVGGKMTFPLGSLYHGSKFAVEGISEALVYELAPLGIRVKIIEPGLIDTDFAGRSFALSVDPEGGPYHPTVNSVLTAFAALQSHAMTPALTVAEAILAAATDGTDQLRYIVGEDAVATLGARHGLDDAAFMDMMRGSFGLRADAGAVTSTTLSSLPG